MKIKKLVVKNYKILRDVTIEFNDDFNILVGDNDSGKSTIIEAIGIALTGRLNHVAIDRQLSTTFFNFGTRNEYLGGDKKVLPEILIELYCDGDSEFKGSNNSLGDNCPGVQVKIEFNEMYESVFKAELAAGEIKDIPIEFYSVKFHYFNGSPIIFRNFPINSAFIDTSKSDTVNVQERFVNSKIEEFVSKDKQAIIDSIYRKYINNFKDDDKIISFKHSLSDKVKINDKKVGFGIKDETINSWKEQISLLLDDEPLTSIGYGTQNIVKIGIALGSLKESKDCLLVEEPENNLSYTNMAKLIDMIVDTKAQIFISTHSSFVANKISLNKLILVKDGVAKSFKDIKNSTFDYFMKLPGYNTLRVVLAEKIMLVEGPTEELVISKYFIDEFGKMPIECGVDIVCVNGLSFKRYLDILILLNKQAVVVTDNDGSIDENIKMKYKDYQRDFISYFYDSNEAFNTFEPSVLNANSKTEDDKKLFKTIIGCDSKTDEETKDYMMKNKTEWALLVFKSKTKIKYPEHIINAVAKLS